MANWDNDYGPDYGMRRRMNRGADYGPRDREYRSGYRDEGAGYRGRGQIRGNRDSEGGRIRPRYGWRDSYYQGHYEGAPGYGYYGREGEWDRPEYSNRRSWSSDVGDDYGYRIFERDYDSEYHSRGTREYDEPVQYTRAYSYHYGEGFESDWMVEGPFTGYGPGGYQRSDQRIEEEVCERLTRHGNVDARNIQVRVENGEVTLEGTVESRRAKRMAEDAIETISGVVDVHNRLRVQDRQRQGAGEHTS